MRMRAAILLVLAAVLGLSAVYLFRNYLAAQLASQGVTQAPQAAAQPEIGKIVVAAVPLRFGNRLGPEHLKEVDWPLGMMPSGAFASTEDLLAGEQRVVLQPIEPNEPVLASKISGPGQRASLSALIDEGMRAMTIRVNDVLGVAGFVLPGDHVDILLTREISKENPITDVLLQNVRVLGIDQLADEKRDQPTVVKAVTLEVSTEQAQKLTLASTVGTLSLALRSVAYVKTEPVERIDLNDLNVSEAIRPAEAKVATTEKPAPRTTVRVRPQVKRDTRVGITRGLVREEYSVTPEQPVAKLLPSRPTAPAAPQATPAAPAPATPPVPSAAPMAPVTPPMSEAPARPVGPPLPLLRGALSAANDTTL